MITEPRRAAAWGMCLRTLRHTLIYADSDPGEDSFQGQGPALGEVLVQLRKHHGHVLTDILVQDQGKNRQGGEERAVAHGQVALRGRKCA